MRDKIIENYINALKEIEPILLSMGFNKCSYSKGEFPFYVEFKTDQCVIKFMFGPPEFQIDITIYTKDKKFEFGDLFKVPAIGLWMITNKYIQPHVGRSIKSELLWFVELIKISLPLINPSC
jgi:hypothetical protein